MTLKVFPQNEDESLVCVHNVRVWFGHECGFCEADPSGYKFIMPNVPPYLIMPALLQARAMLKIEIKTGLRHSKGSILRKCQIAGVTEKRTKRGALVDVNEIIKALGGPEDRNPIK